MVVLLTAIIAETGVLTKLCTIAVGDVDAGTDDPDVSCWKRSDADTSISPFSDAYDNHGRCDLSCNQFCSS